MMPVPGHQDVGCGAVVEFLAAPPFVVLVVAPLVPVGVQDLCAGHINGGGHFVSAGEVKVKVGILVVELVGFRDSPAAVHIEGVIVGGDAFTEPDCFTVVAGDRGDR